MKGLDETSLFHRFTNPRRDKSVYFWSWGSYLLHIASGQGETTLGDNVFMAAERLPMTGTVN